MDERAEDDGTVPLGAPEVLFTDMSGRPVTLDQRVGHQLTWLIGDLRVVAARNGHAVPGGASMRLMSGTQRMQDGDASQRQQPLPDGALRDRDQARAVQRFRIRHSDGAGRGSIGSGGAGGP